MRQPYSQFGFVISEYLVITVLLVSLLFLPMPGFDRSLLQWVLDALALHRDAAIYRLSLP